MQYLSRWRRRAVARESLPDVLAVVYTRVSPVIRRILSNCTHQTFYPADALY